MTTSLQTAESRLLVPAGLDMASPAPYRALIAKFSRTLDEVEALMA